MPGEPHVTRENLGGWILKCNPKLWDFEGFIEENGSGPIHDWSVKPSYRTELMEAGQRVWLWVSGAANASPTPGVWGSGYLTGPCEPGLVDAEGGDDLWIDGTARDAVVHFAQCSISLFDEGYPRSVILAEPRLSTMEVLQAPMMSNPVYVTPDEAAALDEIVGTPGDPPDPVPDEIVLTSDDAGWGDPYTNQQVEWAAMDRVSDAYDAAGWTVDDVSRDRVGWDLTASRDGRVRHIEVKGLSGHRPSVLLTRTEYEKACDDSDWTLAVVTRALHQPTMTEYTYEQLAAVATPYLYRADLDTERDI